MRRESEREIEKGCMRERERELDEKKILQVAWTVHVTTSLKRFEKGGKGHDGIS
jgi:hypothetical protein